MIQETSFAIGMLCLHTIPIIIKHKVIFLFKQVEHCMFIFVLFNHQCQYNDKFLFSYI